VNCGAIPEHLLESEFFGHRRGAFTGAHADTHGYLDIANGGTLFLDEIGELSLEMQVKLLRAIEGGGYFPVGDSRPKHSDFRVIAATNRNLREMVRDGRIREDFFFRIHIIPITLPPLRERREDIPLLVDHYLNQFTQGQKMPELPGKALGALYKYDWPWNNHLILRQRSRRWMRAEGCMKQ
jgi:transcriptional regulator with PAS, ATPase and Fis domain